MKSKAKSFAPSAMPAFRVTITTASEAPALAPVFAPLPRPAVEAQTIPAAARKSAIRPVRKSVLKVTIDAPSAKIKEKAAPVDGEEEDVSAIDLSKYMAGETRDPKLDKKNAKAAAKQGFIAKTDSMKLYMNEVGQIPLISPTIFYVICTNTVLAMMTSAPMIIIGGQSMAMKKGASTLMFMMYNSGFSSSNYTLAAVVSIVTFALTFGFTLVSFIFEQKKVHYQ